MGGHVGSEIGRITRRGSAGGFKFKRWRIERLSPIKNATNQTQDSELTGFPLGNLLPEIPRGALSTEDLGKLAERLREAKKIVRHGAELSPRGGGDLF